MPADNDYVDDNQNKNMSLSECPTEIQIHRRIRERHLLK